MQKTNQNHPIWRLLNWLVILVVVWICSWSSAQNFDETELKMIAMILAAMGGYEAVKGRFFTERDGDEP